MEKWKIAGYLIDAKTSVDYPNHLTDIKSGLRLFSFFVSLYRITVLKIIFRILNCDDAVMPRSCCGAGKNDKIEYL